MERFEKIWLSSENHLEIFKEIKKQKKLLSKLEDPSVGKKYFDFPRIIFRSQIIPVVFESIGRLIISDSSIQFYSNSTNSNFQYHGINKNEKFFINFDQIKDIELVKKIEKNINVA
ncbi:MAG: hypothetical protein COC06_12270 [Bacteroidales bacterium]|nr:MAG: hypothetical protein COC06_12270 [Bacteroidales bacterium]